MKKLALPIVLLLTILAGPRAATGAASSDLGDFVRLEPDGVLYAAAFSDRVEVSVDGSLEAQLVQANVTQDIKTGLDTTTVTFSTFRQDRADFVLPGERGNFTILIARLGPGAKVRYRTAEDQGELVVSESVPTGRLLIDWPVFEAGATGTGRYSVKGSLPIRVVGHRTTEGKTLLTQYAYWEEAEGLLNGTLTFQFWFEDEEADIVPTGEGERRKEGEVIYTFPPCPGTAAAWLAKSPARVVTPSLAMPSQRAEAPVAGPSSSIPVLSIAIAAGAALAAGAVLPRRAVDVWLEREADRVLVRRGRRGPGRVRVVVNFTGGQHERREFVLSRGEVQEVQAPAEWQLAELATPGRRNHGMPTRLEREEAV